MNFARVDLHCHIDGSLYLPWAYETALREGAVSAETTFEEYCSILYRNDYKTREEGMRKFEITCAVMQTRGDLKNSVWHLIRTLNDQELYYAELRFAPQQHCLKGLTQAEVVEAVLEGVNQAKIDFPEIEIGIINCLMHKGKDASVNEKENYETIEVTRQFLGKGVVGLDLAGYENNGDYNLYGPQIRYAKSLGIPCTVHAGEMGEGKNVPIAISWGADRIGHGINCVQNPEWLKQVVETQIPLEVCFTSNCKTRQYAEHPLRQLLDAGAKVVLCSDNMMFSQTELHHEYNMAALLGVDDKTLYQISLNAINSAFCSDEVKERVRAKINKLK